MSTPIGVDSKGGAARDDRKTFNSRVIQAIDDYSTANGLVFGGFTTPPKLLQILLSTHLPTGTNAPDEATCGEYISVTPNLFPKLLKAYRDNSFFELLNDVDMRPLTGLTDYQSGGLPTSHSVRGLQSAFHEPYRGEAHKLLIEVLNEYWESSAGIEPSERPYNWSLSVIQSSGMGKSRMANEAALSVFTIPINIREELSPSLKTYPPPDRRFREYFHGHDVKSDIRLQAENAILLSVLFTKAAELLEKPIFKHETGAALASQWVDYLDNGQTNIEGGTNRNEFLDSVANQADQLRLVELGVLQQNKKTALMKLDHSISRMQNSCRKFVKAISSNDRKAKEVKCIIYFDEAHQLTEPVPPEKETDARSRSPYHNLGTVLSALINFPKFGPSPASHPSVRIAQGLRLFPPFTELPFDIFVDKVFETLENQEKNLSLENVGQMSVMAGFGRSLWYVHHKEWLEHQGFPVIPFAGEKLFVEGNKARLFHSFIAALGNWLNPTCVLFMPSQSIASSCMPDRPEPILAEAAARRLNGPSDGNGIEIQGPEILAQACAKGLLAKGERGGICGRLLVTIAHDIAVRQKSSLPNHHSPDPHFHRPVHVLDFLRALFAKQLETVILKADSVTAREGVPNLETAFANAYIFFSHFALAENSETLSAPNLAVALLRGMALQAKDNQESIDAVIPVHMGDPTKSISPESTSAINLQFRNRKEAKPCRVLRQITVPDEKVAVISIIFELGARKIGEPGLVTITKDIPHNTRSSPSKLHRDDHHYEIVAHGCISETFAAIPSAVEPKYQSLLAAQTIVEDFPRAGKEKSLRAFKNLKPFFNGLQEPVKWRK
ncbi:uncharacterized protein EI90DRAFT_3155509 [Cantharellus anzutake]|uniref:uncharacterized protein n=1 Tax=Cantharellus anzutake TaxID=1750568 RepID=UPI0019088225|nr:uncharacterized protein EI90DRAFT_3155509 [Cantharellus anzutake]KAF8329150.1 hypothetical protein EI90DRAFT_3155509 [Cantharellus anzutake]